MNDLFARRRRIRGQRGQLSIPYTPDGVCKSLQFARQVRVLKLPRFQTSDGVQMDVLHQPTGVGIGLDQVGLEAALKQVPAAPVAVVEAHGVRHLQSAQGLAEIGPGRLYRQVIVV